MKTFVKISIALFLANYSFGQASMEEGFLLLEKGNFKNAEVFFEKYLLKEADNKTAQICYGRAVGLNGRPELANNNFKAMLTVHPNDFEVTINYAESFLWAKRFEEALPIYKSLVVQYPERFGALLGYANTLSNLKEYTKALKWVNQALVLQPQNENAKISKKYILLGLANMHVTDQDYDKGKTILNSIFMDFPDDKDVLLNLANIYLITKQVDSAKTTYARYATSSKDSITAFNGITLAEHIGGEDKEALRIATWNRSKVRAFSDFELTERTYDRYVQALIWNRKFITARRLIDSLNTAHPNRNWILALRATLGLYTGTPEKSISDYEAILEQDSSSFDGNLGKANALFAADRIAEAYAAVEKTLGFYPNQKDAMQFMEKLDAMHTPSVQEHAGYTFDNGNNVAFFSNTTVELPLSTKFKTTMTYGFRDTENTSTGTKANTHLLLAGFQYKLFPKTTLKTVLGLNNSRFMDEVYTQPVLDARLLLKPYKLQDFALSYLREVQNFNADLIAREIVQNHYGLNYNLGTNFGLGWYTQVMHTEQSDENTRDLLFTSLYYSLFRKPGLKLGVNYQYITFKNQVPTLYFSPENYQALELFADFRAEITKKTKVMLSAAIGRQQVEIDPFSGIFRAETGLQHQFSKRLNGNIYGKYSNIASATAAGFEFTEIGFKLRWLFTEKPLF